ncbi:MAG: hypothetical protein JG781_1396 [Peptococcaceae bacterium]|jgi:uncharacterized protein (UPF0335 family)|uniref:Uncharacterized protein n=1 Tax=Thermanaerosceptrum fracticalcis TaxID=1712410 RepID=A0A7G6E4H3_THEFR|nr:hypothetical protein [Thermanaerosceptrum fracticalcis]MBZ4654057.1 hypothetical protein [Peptococcaceae bacterium]QNB46977.1 hypothetical protein BR63_12075 [Thermanaerosceptrum fracticalcis]
MEEKELLKQILEKMTSMEKEISGLKEGQKEHTQLLKAIEHRVEVSDARLCRMEEDVTQIKGHITRITNHLLDHDTDIRLIKKMMSK